MKIIKAGQLPEKKISRFTCHHCSTVLEASAGEGKLTYDQRDGDYVTFTCPVCGKSIHVGHSSFK